MDGLRVSGPDNSMIEIPAGLLTELSAGDIRRRRLSGRPTPGQTFHGNIVESRLEDMEFTSIDLSRCDWKDCRVERVAFYDCDLGHASMITNAFADCRFVRCRFPDTGVSDSSFMGCDFEDCDFTSIIVKSSRFEECLFSRCTTSNRIVESSLLLLTEWRDMELALALITGNFGLRHSELTDCRLVSQIGESQEVSSSNILALPDLSPLERFRLAFFWTGEVDGDADALEAALDLRNWGNDAVIQASFGTQLSSFAQFLLALYGIDRCPLYPLLILHSRNFAFLEWLSTREEFLPLYQVAAGVHLTLTREIDGYVAQLSLALAKLAEAQTIHFAAEGPLEVSYFEEWFAQQGVEGIRVVAVRPRNSPIDLAVIFSDANALIAGLALFLASRTKLELIKVGNDLSGGTEEEPGKGRSLLSFSAGFSKVKPAEYEINVRTILPRSLLLDSAPGGERGRFPKRSEGACRTAHDRSRRRRTSGYINSKLRPVAATFASGVK